MIYKDATPSSSTRPSVKFTPGKRQTTRLQPKIGCDGVGTTSSTSRAPSVKIAFTGNRKPSSPEFETETSARQDLLHRSEDPKSRSPRTIPSNPEPQTPKPPGTPSSPKPEV